MSGLTASLLATPVMNQPAAAAVTPAAGGAPATSTSQFNSMNSQDFMQLLTTELQHQDPDDPVNETQLAGEMAQFSMATGINTLNTNVESLLQGQSASQLAGAAALIGKQVATAGNALVTDGSGHASGAFSLAAPAAQSSVQIVDASGKTVGSVPLGNLGAGLHTFAWTDGKPNAAYTFVLSASGADGQTVGSTPYSVYQVSGVTHTGSGTALALSGNPNALPISNVVQVL
ncbi:MAG TPA: flagellar hook capping FlgD N-terminal domain-containing protein [Rhodanobacteraceae bacterium]